MATRHVCAGAVLAGLFAPVALAQPIATDRIEAAMIIAGGGREIQIPIVEERLQVTIDGQHATTTLLQAYQHNNSGQIEGRYKLRPGFGSRVEGFAYWNGEQKIVGEVFERQTAQRVYTNVTTKRRDPGLLEEDGEGAFAFKVFPINAQEKKRVELRWTKWLERRGQSVRYRAPVTRNDAAIVVNLIGAVKNVRSTTHKVHVEKVAGGLRLRADSGRGGGELVIDWEVDEVEWLPSAYVHTSGAQHDGWFALSLATADMNPNQIAPKDVTIVIDRSGSMIGEPLSQAKAAAVDMINMLNKKDRVNVIAFSDEVDPLWKNPQPLDGDARQRAIAYVNMLHDGGGTDIALALSTAIASQQPNKERPRVVVFMTDGQSDIDKAVAAAKTDTGDVRLFTLGLGKDVNRPLLSRLAALKRGKFVYIEKSSAIQAEVARLSSHIAKPLLVDVSVEVDGAQAVRLYPRSLPDLFVDDELVVRGRIRGTGPAKFTIKGRLGGKPVAFSRTVDLAKAPSRPWVGRLWAQARVDHLLEEISLGSKEPELMTEVLELALAYNFVTPYTAFLAIPESELGTERDTVMAARERKAKIMAQNADAASLDKDGKSGNVQITADRSQNVPAPGRTFTADQSDASPQNPRHITSTGADDEPSESYATVKSRNRGCAGCASQGDASLFLGLGGLVWVLGRRRRTTRAS
ncbi:MAG: VWA domain-containing protein [Kofleriaceae bacterium]